MCSCSFEFVKRGGGKEIFKRVRTPYSPEDSMNLPIFAIKYDCLILTCARILLEKSKSSLEPSAL